MSDASPFDVSPTAPPLTVSVIIVSNARPAGLARVLKALEYQRFDQFEVIVVSDLPDGERPQTPLQVRWFDYSERNISRARNIGLAQARGTLVAFIDDDAVPEFGWLAALVPVFGDPRVASAGGFVRGRNGVGLQSGAVLVDRLGRDIPVRLEDTAPRIFAPDPQRFLKTVGTNSIYRRDALMAIGGFDGAFRFFLDEADVNLRLAEAGWHAASVPTAEVHHGFAAGPLRTNHRVPTSLFEIGASLALWLARYAPAADHAARLAGFRAEQNRRMEAHYLLGRVTRADWRRRLAEVEAGFADGRHREAELMAARPQKSADPGPDPARRPFVPVTLRTTGRRRLFVVPMVAPGGQVADAAAAAAEGDEVTVFRPNPTQRPVWVAYGGDGAFHHRFGWLGKGSRDDPRPVGGLANRIALERKRISAQRGPFEI